MLLMRGSQGPSVAALQNQLNAAAKVPLQYTRQPPLVVDGIFGGATQARVTEFQMINRLGADGVVGPQTQGALDALVGPAQTWRPSGGAGANGVYPKVEDKWNAGGFPKVQDKVLTGYKESGAFPKTGGAFPKLTGGFKY